MEDEQLKKLLMSDNEEDNLIAIEILRSKKEPYWIAKLNSLFNNTFPKKYFYGYVLKSKWWIKINCLR